jgi:parvulin-like peptidyl-prolyl isomerase
LSAGDSTFDAAAVKVDTSIVSIREVEAVFSDSYVLIQDKLKSGELSKGALGDAIRLAWTEALDTATQDKIIDNMADKQRKDLIQLFLARTGGDASAYRRLEADEVRKIRRELVSAAGGEDELKAALKRKGQTLEDWEKGLVRELFRRWVLYSKLGVMIASPAATKAYFDKHPEQFRESESWRLKRIRISKAGMGEVKFTSPENAAAAAKFTYDKITKDNFDEIAAKISDDPAYAKEGGLLTRTGKTDLPTGNFPFEEKVARELKDGEWSKPVDAGDWFIIVKREAYRPPSVQTFEKALDKAEALAFGEKLKQKKKELFDKLKSDAYIQVLQKDPPAHLMKMVENPEGDFVTPTK